MIVYLDMCFGPVCATDGRNIGSAPQPSPQPLNLVLAIPHLFHYLPLFLWILPLFELPKFKWTLWGWVIIILMINWWLCFNQSINLFTAAAERVLRSTPCWTKPRTTSNKMRKSWWQNSRFKNGLVSKTGQTAERLSSKISKWPVPTKTGASKPFPQVTLPCQRRERSQTSFLLAQTSDEMEDRVGIPVISKETFIQPATEWEITHRDVD